MGEFFVGGVWFCPVHCSVFSSIPGLYQWAWNTPSCLVVKTNRDTQCHMSPKEQICLWSSITHSQHRTQFSLYSFVYNYIKPWASLLAQWWRIHLLVQETWIQSLGWEGPLVKKMATCSSILAWEIPWTEEHGRRHSPWGHKRVRHNLVTQQQYIKTHMLKKNPINKRIKNGRNHEGLIFAMIIDRILIAISFLRFSNYFSSKYSPFFRRDF